MRFRPFFQMLLGRLLVSECGLLLLVLGACCLNEIVSPPVQAQPPLRAVRLAPEPAANTAEGVLRRVEDRYRTIIDYQCRAELESRLGERQEAGEYRLCVKQPGMLRLHVERGRGRGSDLAMARDGSIRGRKGGVLKAFVIRLDADDKRLRSIRGGSVTEFDWGSFYKRLRAHASLPGARLTLLPRTGEPTAPYELVVTYSSEGKQYRETTRIDPSLWVMVEGHVYEENVLVDHVRFSEIRLNTGLTDNYFRF